MDICLYEDWMKPQVAKLFHMQYGITIEGFSELIDNFYEHSFQKDKCIRIVAKEGDTIIGFQSFFFWPYIYNDRTINSYQSGNSLIHPDYRGKGIFQKLLNYLDQHKEKLNIDVLIGFPIDASVGSLLRNKWFNVFNLQWFMKIQNPLSLIFPVNHKKLSTYFPTITASTYLNTAERILKLSQEKEFNSWRDTHYDRTNYFSFVYKTGNHELIMKLKINIRKRFIKELIIGDLVSSSYQAAFLKEAFISFLKTVKKVNCITIISVACNTACAVNVSAVFMELGFNKINKQIYFCVKPFTDADLYKDATKWMIFRGDIDTW